MDNDFVTGYTLGSDGRDGHADGMWGGQWVWAFLIIALLFRGGLFGGNGYGDGNGSLTRSDLCEGFNFNNLDNAVRGVQNGLCDGFYAMNTSILNGFHGVDNALCSLGNNLGNQIQQARFDSQQCCCETQRLIERGFCDVINAGNQNTQRIIDKMTCNEVQTLRDQLQTANFQLSQQAQNATLINALRPTPVPSYITCSPYESALMYSGYGRGGCGCC